MLNLKHIYLLNKVTNTYTRQIYLFEFTEIRKSVPHTLLRACYQAKKIINDEPLSGDFAQLLSKLTLILNCKEPFSETEQ